MLTLWAAIPKGHTIFRFEIPQPSPEVDAAENGDVVDGREPDLTPPNLVFELHGSQFENRATDRATKKFKQRRLDGL